MSSDKQNIADMVKSRIALVKRGASFEEDQESDLARKHKLKTYNLLLEKLANKESNQTEVLQTPREGPIFETQCETPLSKREEETSQKTEPKERLATKETVGKSTSRLDNSSAQNDYLNCQINPETGMQPTAPLILNNVQIINVRKIPLEEYQAGERLRRFGTPKSRLSGLKSQSNYRNISVKDRKQAKDLSNSKNPRTPVKTTLKKDPPTLKEKDDLDKSAGRRAGKRETSLVNDFTPPPSHRAEKELKTKPAEETRVSRMSKSPLSNYGQPKPFCKIVQKKEPKKPSSGWVSSTRMPAEKLLPYSPDKKKEGAVREKTNQNVRVKTPVRAVPKNLGTIQAVRPVGRSARNSPIPSSHTPTTGRRTKTPLRSQLPTQPVSPLRSERRFLGTSSQTTSGRKPSLNPKNQQNQKSQKNFKNRSSSEETFLFSLTSLFGQLSKKRLRVGLNECLLFSAKRAETETIFLRYSDLFRQYSGFKLIWKLLQKNLDRKKALKRKARLVLKVVGDIFASRFQEEGFKGRLNRKERLEQLEQGFNKIKLETRKRHGRIILPTNNSSAIRKTSKTMDLKLNSSKKDQSLSSKKKCDISQTKKRLFNEAHQKNISRRFGGISNLGYIRDNSQRSKEKERPSHQNQNQTQKQTPSAKSRTTSHKSANLSLSPSSIKKKNPTPRKLFEVFEESQAKNSKITPISSNTRNTKNAQFSQLSKTVENPSIDSQYFEVDEETEYRSSLRGRFLL